jgi:BirA family biotin operon repressor/biotin-[acetyl-CoA-carboxylase] ligase
MLYPNINKHEILSNLDTKILGKEIFIFDSIGSTNEYGKLLSSNLESEGYLIITDHQTAGYGKFKRKWVSEAGKNLLFSFILKPKIIANEKIHLLTFFIANRIADIVEHNFNLKVGIKWSNDLFIDGKKFCGILLESLISGEDISIICGIGINVNQTFYFEHNKNITSLKTELNMEIDRVELLCKILNKLDADYFSFLQTPEIEVELFKKRDILIGKEITVSINKNIYTGKFIDIDKDGRSVLSVDGVEMKLNSGDVTLKI